MGNFQNEGGFEEQLRRELRPRSAPQGLADRIVQRAENAARLEVVTGGTKSQGRARILHLPVVRWAVAAMLLVMVALGGYMEHLRQERIAGEHARQQVLLALRITSSTLQAVHNKVVDDDRSSNKEESQ